MTEKNPSEYFTIEVKDHGSNLLQSMNKARLEERLCDFKIQVGKQVIHAHKIVLAEGCDYFRAMFSYPMKETNEGFVEMADLDFECLKICIDYIYLGKVTAMKEKLQSLLVVAHRLQLNELYKEVAKNLEDSLSIETFFSTKGVASSLDLRELGEKCDTFALNNLSGIALQENFVTIDPKYLEFLMTAKVSLAVKCKTLLIWANHDPDSRGSEFEEFFMNIDVDGLLPSHINFMKQNEPLFFNSVKCLTKVMQLNLSAASSQDIDLRSYQGIGEFWRFAVFDANSNAIQEYDPNQDAWTELSKLSSEISSLDSFTAIAVGGDIFVFAEDRRNWKFRYSDENPRWSRVPKRSFTWVVKAVEVDGLIYAFDETHGDSKAVEVYDRVMWSHVTDKPFPGFQTYIVAVEDSIYCIGGYTDEEEYHSHCTKYETEEDCWSTLPSMPEKRSWGGAAELNQKIYVIGGYHCSDSNNDNTVIATTLVFDIETEVWSEVASMTIPRFGFCAIPVAGKIFAVGGYSSRDDPCYAVEEFGPVTGKWRAVTFLTGKDVISTATVAL